MRWIFALVLTLLAPAAAFAGGDCCSARSPEKALLDLEERHKVAFVTYLLERTVDFGAEGRVVVQDVQVQDPQVRVYEGGTAIVTGLWQVRGTVDGRPAETPHRFSHVWVRGGEGWTLMSSESIATRE